TPRSASPTCWSRSNASSSGVPALAEGRDSLPARSVGGMGGASRAPMYKRVKLAEKRGVRRQVRFEERARLLVRRGGGDQPMAREHATRGRVGDGHRPAGRIEQDLIDGLRAETRQRE